MTKVNEVIYNMSLADLKVLENSALAKSQLQQQTNEWQNFAVAIHHVILLKTQKIFDDCKGLVFEE
jgi:hypothetical protein